VSRFADRDRAGSRVVSLSLMCFYCQSKKIGEQPCSNGELEGSAAGSNTKCSQTHTPGPPWVTFPWARQKRGASDFRFRLCFAKLIFSTQIHNFENSGPNGTKVKWDVSKTDIRRQHCMSYRLTYRKPTSEDSTVCLLCSPLLSVAAGLFANLFSCNKNT
jgi:hypothetical protein